MKTHTKIVRRWSAAGLVFLLALLLGASPAAAVTEIKVALVTPEGSAWTEALHRMAAEIEKRTGGEVRFIVYAGGISGDELDVLRKMRVNRIHAAGFSGVGLGVILPEIRILEAPLLFADYDEIDFVKERLYDTFAERFAEKGYVMLGFAEAGFVYFFSKTPLRTPQDIRSVKMWAWEGDPVAEIFMDAFGIHTFPLHITDVNTGLERGMIDAFYAPPLAAVAFQWHSRARHMLDYPMVNSTGALLLNRRVFQQLSVENQKILADTAREYAHELVRLSRRDNAEALKVLKEAHVAFETPTPELVASFRKSAEATYEKSIPGIYSRELFDRVKALIQEYRAGK
ncbi:MAG: TRAP transporter substrate-binding protein DctP [Desulfobacterales bacterium]|jgi:TRAP-type C4-dicarboxylate transport system substrate-binding protein